MREHWLVPLHGRHKGPLIFESLIMDFTHKVSSKPPSHGIVVQRTEAVAVTLSLLVMPLCDLRRVRGLRVNPGRLNDSEIWSLGKAEDRGTRHQ